MKIIPNKWTFPWKKKSFLYPFLEHGKRSFTVRKVHAWKSEINIIEIDLLPTLETEFAVLGHLGSHGSIVLLIGSISLFSWTKHGLSNL